MCCVGTQQTTGEAATPHDIHLNYALARAVDEGVHCKGHGGTPAVKDVPTEAAGRSPARRFNSRATLHAARQDVHVTGGGIHSHGNDKIVYAPADTSVRASTPGTRADRPTRPNGSGTSPLASSESCEKRSSPAPAARSRSSPPVDVPGHGSSRRPRSASSRRPAGSRTVACPAGSDATTKVKHVHNAEGIMRRI